MNIVGNKVVLRAIEEEDLPLLHIWANDPEIWRMLTNWYFPISKKEQKKWFENLSLNSVNQRFGIHVEGEGLIGTANLMDINWKDRNARQGIMIGQKHLRGRGYGEDTIRTIMKYAFEELCLNRLDANIIAYNKPSLGVYEKCGWKREGIRKDWYFRQNRFWDKVLIGITRKEYFHQD